MSEPSHDSQVSTLTIFAVLRALRPEWAGNLILSCGLRDGGSDLALAANIAGAACLSLDGSPEACRAALRRGAVDFVVNSLDEALRALKNEVRKSHPLSVALAADPAGVLGEILERGVLPEMVSIFAEDQSEPSLSAFQDAAATLAAMGAVPVDFDGTLSGSAAAVSATQCLARFTSAHGLGLHTFSFSSAADLRTFDVRLLHAVQSDHARRRWMLAASRHFGRPPAAEARLYRRAVFLTPGELQSLAPAAEDPTSLDHGQ